LSNSKSNSGDRPYVKSEYPLSDITDRIIGAAIEVHRNLGPGFEGILSKGFGT
jgi:hypothetical protein